MASRDPLRHNGSSVVMTFGRAPYLIAGGLLASVAVLWMAATGPLPHFAAPSAAAGTVDFTVAVNPRRKMILAADCSAEIKSCGDWAAIGVAADHVVTPSVHAPDQGRHLYSAVVSNDLLWTIVRANRCAAQCDVLGSGRSRSRGEKRNACQQQHGTDEYGALS